MSSALAEPDTVVAGRAAIGEVELVRWPAEAARRRELAEVHAPCILVVGRVDDPPSHPGPLEDWLREPIDPLELDVRVERLAHLARNQARRPRVDSNGVLWMGSTWIVVPPAQVRVMTLLVEHLGRVVNWVEISTAVVEAGSSPDIAAVRSSMRRLAARLAPGRLELRCVRGRGYLLNASPESCAPLTGPRPSPSR